MTAAYSRDTDVQHVLTVCIERRHFAGAALGQIDVDILRHALVALADRAALCADQSKYALYDTTEAAKRHMRGEP